VLGHVVELHADCFIDCEPLFLKITAGNLANNNKKNRDLVKTFNVITAY
jgi:hypothetical protein